MEDRFQTLWAELAKVHVEEVEQLRAEVAHLRFAGLDARTRGDASDANDVKEEVDDAREQCLRREFCRAEDEETLDETIVDAAVAEEMRNAGPLPDTELPTKDGSSPPLSPASVVEKVAERELDWGEDSHVIHTETERAIIKRVSDIFLGPTFEFATAILLIFNLLLMAAQLQYHGIKMGHEMNYPHYDYEPEMALPGAENFFLGADVAFAIIFTLEMLIRFSKIGWLYFKNLFNWVDFVVVCSSWVELFAAALPISPTFLRMLRLGKLLRAIRVVKMSQVLESLQLLLKCIHASLRILFWSLVLLMIIQCSAGMTISYMLSDYMADTGIDDKRRFEVFRYYGTFTKTLLTMFEVLFANWAPACRVLVDNVGEGYSAVFIIYRCFVGFAVLNVVNAVFVQSTMKVAQADDELMSREKARTQAAYHERITALFRQVDTSGDGMIDASEFQELLQHPKLQLWLHQLEVETNDLVGLFNMLDDGDGEISLEEFESGLMRIKGIARSYDLNKLQRDISRMSSKMDMLFANSPYTRGLIREKMDRKKSLSNVSNSAPSPSARDLGVPSPSRSVV